MDSALALAKAATDPARQIKPWACAHHARLVIVLVRRKFAKSLTVTRHGGSADLSNHK